MEHIILIISFRQNSASETENIVGRMICRQYILLGLIYLYTIVTHKDKHTIKKDMQKAEPGMGFITCKILGGAQILMCGTRNCMEL